MINSFVLLLLTLRLAVNALSTSFLFLLFLPLCWLSLSDISLCNLYSTTVWWIVLYTSFCLFSSNTPESYSFPIFFFSQRSTYFHFQNMFIPGCAFFCNSDVWAIIQVFWSLVSLYVLFTNRLQMFCFLSYLSYLAQLVVRTCC